MWISAAGISAATPNTPAVPTAIVAGSTRIEGPTPRLRCRREVSRSWSTKESSAITLKKLPKITVR